MDGYKELFYNRNPPARKVGRPPVACMCGCVGGCWMFGAAGYTTAAEAAAAAAARDAMLWLPAACFAQSASPVTTGDITPSGRRVGTGPWT